MNNDNRIISCADMMTNIADFTPLASGELPSVWKKVVSNIGKKKEDENNYEEISIGERIAANSHIVDLKNGVLLIEANHSGWIQYIKMYKNFILKGLNWALPNLKITSFAFRVSGSTANLSDQYNDLVKKEQEKMQKKIEDDEKKLAKSELVKTEKSAENTSSKESLPPELIARFENLKKMMKDDEK